MIQSIIELLEIIGPEVEPFERKGFSSQLLPGETEILKDQIYDATEDGYPENTLFANVDIENPFSKQTRYLWVIKSDGIFIIPEATPNPLSSRGIACHTNITGGKKAYQGGELWFGTDNKIYINPKSGRYGAENELQWETVIKIFQLAGYKEVVSLFP